MHEVSSKAQDNVIGNSSSRGKPLQPQQRKDAAAIGQTGKGVTDVEASSSTPNYRAVPQVVNNFHVMQRPTPRAQVEDPREFQVGQIRRRFSPQESAVEDATLFTFKMVPSDPDFPFDIEALECVLRVPMTYPSMGAPSLKITNSELKRGFQINVERGFDKLHQSSPSATLLGLMNRLDKQLENILSAQEASTVKIVANTKISRPLAQHETSLTATPLRPDPSQPAAIVFAPEQKAQAQSKRTVECRQLEARLGKLPLFSKSGDGVTYTLPFEAPKKNELPQTLQWIRTVRLIVPVLYNLQPCRLQLSGIDEEVSRRVEQAFELKAKQSPDMTLMAHINYLSQHLRMMAEHPQPAEPPGLPSMEHLGLNEAQPKDQGVSVPSGRDVSEREHIQYIPRPPEWSNVHTDGESSSEGSLTYDSGDDTEDAEDSDLDEQETPIATSAERGVMLSFPFLELHGVELLELVTLSITVKCERCKDTLDVERLKNNSKGDISGMRQESCKKCANALGIGASSYYVLHYY
ncbi:hypothetical protein LTR50_003417 [Elasticomyces elasticus]|nr:hypothetical protein LTR50_003417 [Elasticomyces elasticus]